MRKTGMQVLASLFLLGSVFYLSGCTDIHSKPAEITVTSKKPDADEVLRLNKHADIFQWDGTIYAIGVEWVNKLQLTKKVLIGEISQTSQQSFKDGTANTLPAGTKIYSAEERNDVLIVDYDGNLKYYLAQAEG
ncbi:hypothetical protein [Peribacillus kribbensis]|uniref:hypothetical protein n=1 Tax=Peribacillus kribbensis TaxID=356658 RepID=UPI00040DFAFC|nr:hypothetical protein [Peribacillus kribbensis]